MNAPDPYNNFRFRIKWEGRPVAGFSTFTRPRRFRRLLRRSKYEAVTLERGVTHDPEFQQWADKAWRHRAGGARRDIVVEEHDESGQLVRVYGLLRCWVSKYQAVPDLDANANAVEIEHLKLEHEGFERDDDIPDPVR